MKKKTNKINLLICGAAFVVMIVVMFIEGIDKMIYALSRMNPLFLLAAVMCMLIYWLTESISVHLPAKSIDKNTSFKTSVIVTMIGQYFNCITPFASGGQPMQAYTYVKRGMSLGSAMTALLARFIVYQFMLTVYSVVFLIFKLPEFIDGKLKPLTFLVIVGFVINTIVIIMLFMLAFFRAAATKLAHFTVRVLGKIKLIKDVEGRIEYIDSELEQYYENFLFIKSRPAMIIKMLAATALQLLVYFSITYVIYLGFGLSGTDYFTIIACQAFVLMISSFVPLPGAMGAAEGSYGSFFHDIFGDFTLISTFIWRFLTFYLPILVGIGINLSLSRQGIDLTEAEQKINEAAAAEANEGENTAEE